MAAARGPRQQPPRRTAAAIKLTQHRTPAMAENDVILSLLPLASSLNILP